RVTLSRSRTTVRGSSPNSKHASSRFSSASIATTNSKARESASRPSAGFWNATTARSGRKALRMKAQRFLFPFQNWRIRMITRQRPILVVDDDENDIDLELAALRASVFKNQPIVARDGLEALRVLEGRQIELGELPPLVVLLDNKMTRMSGMEFLQ